MGIMMPGRIRREGIDLYQREGLSYDVSDMGVLTARFIDCDLHYDLVDDSASCSCILFLEKRYCHHLAAVEHFLRHAPDGQAFSEHYRSTSASLPIVSSSMGRLFLEELHCEEDHDLKYRLSAIGTLQSYVSEFWWTLKINRLPDERSYVIKDIMSFLRIVMQNEQYQIGKHYYETLSLAQFDEASQELIVFLWRLLAGHDDESNAFFLKNYGRHLMFSSGFFKEGLSLMMALYDFTLEDDKVYKEVFFEPLSAAADLFHFKVRVNRDSILLTVREKAHTPYMNEAYLKVGNTFYELNREQIRLVKQLHTLPIAPDLSKQIVFQHEDRQLLALSLPLFKSIGVVEAPSSFEIRDFVPVFSFDLGANQEVVLALAFDYGDFLVTSKADLSQLPFTSHTKREKQVFSLLQQEGFAPVFRSEKRLASAQAIYDFFEKSLKRFERLGQVIVSDSLQKLRLSEVPLLHIDQQDGLLDISFDFSNLDEVDLEVAKQALLANQPYFMNHQGQLVVFDDETSKVSHVLAYLRSGFGVSHLGKLPKAVAYHLSQVFGDLDSLTFSKTCHRLLEDLRNPETFSVPEKVTQLPLRDYQLYGVKWLSMLNHYGFGGVLADDMGLGKTLQAIAFLLGQLKTDDKVLILAPSSLIYNWQDEFKRFAPDLDVKVVCGNKLERQKVISHSHHILITSYASFRQDKTLYEEQFFHYVILDEAQMMKNSQTKLAQALRQLKVGNCFALSGTPVENHLLDIWSIFQLVLPGLLPPKKAFLSLSSSEVARYLKPFVLRRRKEAVLPELPALSETIYYNDLKDEQKALYLAQVEEISRNLTGLSQGDFQRQRMTILAGLTRLRQICNSPALFMPYEGESGKLESLSQLLTQFKENGRRALIFSQFKGTLLMVEKQLMALGLSSYMLTGSTPSLERQEMTRSFNQGGRDMFLISLKAGGVGLNLTGADAVVLIDLWWNPAVENQAISRAHRLGQQKPVDVYRLITKGTIEEKILDLQEQKKALFSTVLDEQASLTNLNLEDIKAILGLS